MNRRQRKLREIRMRLWRIFRSWKIIVGLLLLTAALAASSAIIGTGLVLASDALLHFTHGADDKTNWCFGISFLTIFAEIAFFSWYYSDEE